MDTQQINDQALLTEVLGQLAEHEIVPAQIGDVVYELVHGYILDLTSAIATDSVMHVLAKREVQNAILTGLALDKLATQHLLPEPLQTIVENDDGLYGIDEQIAMSITSVYGSIGVTNFGFVDRTKPGVIGVLNNHKDGAVNTFADDLVGAVAAAAAARLAHDNPNAVRKNFGVKHE